MLGSVSGAYASSSCRRVSPENSVRRDAEQHTRGRVCSPDLSRNRGLAVRFSGFVRDALYVGSSAEPDARLGSHNAAYGELCEFGFARRFSLSRRAVELKFSSHRSITTSTSSSHRRGWDYLACGELCEFGFARRVALSRRAVELKFSSHLGEGGIRTHGGRKAHSGFQDRRIRPLCHLSLIGFNRLRCLISGRLR